MTNMRLKIINTVIPLLLILLLWQCSEVKKKSNMDKTDFDRFKDFVPKDTEVSNKCLSTIKTKDSTYYFELLVLTPKDTSKNRQILILQETPRGLAFKTKCDSAILNPKFGIDPFINIYTDSSGFSILHAGGDDNWEMSTTFHYKPDLKDWYLHAVNSKNEVAYKGCDTSAMFGPLMYVEDLSEMNFGLVRFSEYSIYNHYNH